ncbi:MAG: cation-translocating P-type ATPase [Treponema sp.]|jgi:Cd2+/Zn2+-exporting ATPase/Cu+-exporting ATPase|nr:cation-translocating P-type ATPase [Treponema sp.]
MTVENIGKSLASRDYLSDKDKRKFKNNILSISLSLVCLVAALIYGWIFPEQDIVIAIIFLAGILVIGVPIFVTAVQGLISKNMKCAMEILVSIAVIVSALSGEFVLAILIPVILTFVHFLEEKSIMGGRDAIEGLKKMQAETAVLLKDGGETEVDAKELKCGDIIVVRPGMALPVDGEVCFGVSSIDQKSLTGESVPNTVRVNDPVFAGTVNIDGSIQVKVTKEYSDTSFQKIVKLLEESEHITIPETKIVDTFIFYYIPLVLVTSLLVWLFTQDITRAIAILVVSCPCGLLLINSAPMIAVLSSATKKGILIKNSAFVNHLSETDYIVFDKTGTITNGILEADSFHLEAAADFDSLLTTAACVAHASLHPISKSIISLCEAKEFARDYEIKEHIGKGLEGKRGDDLIYLGSYRWVKSLGFDVPEKYENAGTCNWIIKNGKILGCIVFKDTPRDDAAQVVGELKDIGVRQTCLLTGDRFQTAERIQTAVGIDQMRCELLPEQKLEYVEGMMKDHTVTVIGDGINDALALSKAHVGIAMGAMGSDTAIQSADIALMNNNLANIPFAVKLARKTKGIIYQNIVLAFSMSIVMIFLAGIGFVSPIAGAFLHNLGAFVILANSGRVMRLSRRVAG